VEKFIGIDVFYVDSIAELMGQTRKAIEGNKFVFIDYKDLTVESNENVKKAIDSLHRSFSNVEFLICLSSIHSELYNKSVIEKYSGIANGFVMTHLDLCLNFGSIFNLSLNYPKQPLKLFGTGEVIPNDFENASAERILAGIFKL
jgi:flagellar biosynthesis protein FlhF